jgi:hypothetical protein
VRGRSATLAAAVALAAVAAGAAPRAGAVTVSLSVESAEAPAPLFAATVDTQPHPVDGGDGSGPHPCAGPPGGSAEATATGALDDGLRDAGISWRGNWDPSFRDFFIDRIGPYASMPPDRYWSLTVNGRFSAGGCLTRVAAGDSVRFFYGPLFGVAPGAEPGGEEGSAGGRGGEGPSGEGAHGRRPRGLRRIAIGAARFLKAHRGAGDGWARLVLSVRAGDGPAAAARELLGGALASQAPDGSFDADVNATALAVLALRGNRPAAARAAAWLVEAQSSAGGFGYRPGAPADVDTTGLASWALAAEERSGALHKAAAFIRAAQGADGGFPALPGGSSNSQSTGLATVALRVAGEGPLRTLSDTGQSPLDYLASLAQGNGALAYARHSSPTPIWSTSQALLGLTSKAKLLAWGSEGGGG